MQLVGPATGSPSSTGPIDVGVHVPPLPLKEAVHSQEEAIKQAPVQQKAKTLAPTMRR